MKQIFAVALMILSLLSLAEIAKSMRVSAICGSRKCRRSEAEVRRQCRRSSIVRAWCKVRQCRRGKWSCIPTRTTTPTITSTPTPSPSMTPTPSPSPSPLPTQATGYTYGDPHIVTYDEFRFDCQAAGEFVLTKSIGTNAACTVFEVHGRFRESPGNSFSLSSGIAASEDRAPVVQFSMSTDPTQRAMVLGGCRVVAFVDGVLTNFNEGDHAVGPERNTMVVRHASMLTAHFPSGMRVQIIAVNTLGCYFRKMVVTIPGLTVATCPIVGLFGTPNGRQNDDFTDSGGNLLPISRFPRGRDATDFCVNNWAISSDSLSLFDFEAGDSFQNAVEADSLTREGPDIGAAPQDIQNICEGNEECLIDGMLVDAELAANTLEDQREAEALAEEPIFIPMAPTDAPVRFIDTSKVVKKSYGSFYTS